MYLMSLSFLRLIGTISFFEIIEIGWKLLILNSKSYLKEDEYNSVLWRTVIVSKKIIVNNLKLEVKMSYFDIKLPDKDLLAIKRTDIPIK